MLSFFRNFLKSKIGAGVALAALALIAIAFASGDIAGLRNSAGLGSGSAVATVGGEAVEGTLLAQGATRALERVKQQQPTATMKLLVAQGGVEQVLSDLIDRTAFYVFGKNHKILPSDRLIDSEIAQIQAFQGVDGKFDQKAFRQALAQQGISEAALREDIAHNLTAQELMAPASIGTVMPEYAARQYAALLTETRSGSVAALPSLAFAPAQDPTAQQLAAFYQAHTNAFIRPERRVIRYAMFDKTSVKAPAAPTDAEIAARFAANKAIYAAQDSRKITQLIVPTEAAATAIAAEVAAGKPLEAAARAKGLNAASLAYFSREELSAQFSPAIAAAVFAAPVGKLAVPQKSALGWHVVRVDEEQKKPARTLAEVRTEIAQQIAEEKSRKAFTDMAGNIEEQIDNGANLPEVAKAFGLEVKSTAPVTADGQIYAKPGETIPPDLGPVLKTAFSMDQEQAQVAPAVPGQTFVLFDVTEITPSAPAPLAEIMDDVKEAWKIDTGSKAARAAAIRMQGEIGNGKTIEQAMAALAKPLPPVQNVSMTRPELSAALQSGKQVPPPVSLLFHMATGTVKVQAAMQNRVWFVVQLKSIQPGKADSGEMIAGARRELGRQLGQAYGDALALAIRKDVGVTQHPKAIKAVRDQLAGTAPAN